MKNSTLIILTALIFLIVSCGPTVEQAIEYNDNIIEENEEIIKKIEELINTYDKFDPEEMDSALDSAQVQTQKGIDFANKLEPFDNDTSFKNGALKLFSAYKSVLDIEHKRIIELLKLPEKDYGDNEVAEFDKLIESAGEKVDIELEKLIAVQESFAKKHKFETTKE